MNLDWCGNEGSGGASISHTAQILWRHGSVAGLDGLPINRVSQTRFHANMVVGHLASLRFKVHGMCCKFMYACRVLAGNCACNCTVDTACVGSVVHLCRCFNVSAFFLFFRFISLRSKELEKNLPNVATQQRKVPVPRLFRFFGACIFGSPGSPRD